MIRQVPYAIRPDLSAGKLLRPLASCQKKSFLVTSAELAAGFEFEGERIRLAPTRQGIWKPRQLGENGAALTILTAPARLGRPAPYDDQLDEDTGYFVYRYEGTDPGNPRNRAVRLAMELGRPLIAPRFRFHADGRVSSCYQHLHGSLR